VNQYGPQDRGAKAMTEDQLTSLEQWAACDLGATECAEVQALVDSYRISRLQARQQHDAGAHVYMREAIELLRRQRDRHGNKANRYDELTIVVRNLRDAYEWLWPILWTDDAEFVPFDKRSPTVTKPMDAPGMRFERPAVETWEEP
jgi:hypothetical protein